MSKLHIKKGDEVIVLAGKNKNSKGKVLKVLVKEEKAIVEGVNMVSRALSLMPRTLREVLSSKKLLFISQILV